MSPLVFNKVWRHACLFLIVGGYDEIQSIEMVVSIGSVLRSRFINLYPNFGFSEKSHMEFSLQTDLMPL